MLHRLVEFAQPLAASFGGPGLAVLAFLDSSFLSFPEVPDLLVVWLVVRKPSLWIYYAAMPTIGSVVGCYVLYALARRGGEAVFRRRFRPATFERTLEVIRRYGLLAVMVPAILPPPMPLKIFVIVAGLAGIGPGAFLAAIVAGRAFRYGVEAFVAYRYGDRAITFLNQNLGRVSIALAVAVAVVGVVVVVWRRVRPQ